MKRSTNKRALLMSALAMLLSISMLIGTTFAWFTDSVQSGTNQIVAGNLDIEFYHADKGTNGLNEKVGATTKLFDDVDSTKWEPGAMAWEIFTVRNEGDLALKYKLTLNALNATEVIDANGEKVSFASMLKVAVVDGSYTYDRAAIMADANLEWKSLETFTKTGEIEADDDTTDDVYAEDVYGVIIWWQPTEIDNLFNMNNDNKGKTVSIDVCVDLYATQLTAEEDGFGTDYDEDAEYPMIEKTESGKGVSGETTVITVATAPSISNKVTKVTLPANAIADGETAEITVNPDNTLFNVSADGDVVAKIDVKLSVEGNPTNGLLTDGSLYTVETYISKGLTNPTIEFTGVDQVGYEAPQIVEYDETTGYLKFTTNHFSEYAVKSAVFAYDRAADVAISDIKELVSAITDPNSKFVVPSIEVVEDAIDNAVESGELSEDEAQDVLDNVQIVKNSVARVGEEYFATLAEAVEVANGTEAAIVLLVDVELDEGETFEIAEGYSVVIDFNGYAIIGNIAKTVGHVIRNNGDLTLMGGCVKSTANNGGSAIYNVAGATLEINGTTVVGAPQVADSFPSYAINNYGEMTVNGANVESNHGAISVYGDTVINDATVTMNGFGGSSHVFYVGGEGTELTVNAGTYTHKGNVDGSLAYVMNGTTMTVNGGKFSASNGGYGIAAYNGSVVINGGIFANAVIDWGGPITITGGTFAAMPADKYVAEGFSAVKNGNVYTVIPQNMTAVEGYNGVYRVEGNEYIVYTAEGLASMNKMMADKTAGQGTVLNIGADIDFAGYTWTPVDSHADTAFWISEINGNGHTVYNLTVKGQAMFKRFAGSGDVVVKDITFDGANVNSNSAINTSILTAQTYQNVLLDNVDVKNSTITGGYKVAPLIATVYNESSTTITATLKNCDVSNTVVTATSYDFCTTGMVAFVYADDNDKIEFENCSVTNVSIFAPNSYTAHAWVYTTGSNTLFNNVPGVTVSGCTFAHIQ